MSWSSGRPGHSTWFGGLRLIWNSGFGHARPNSPLGVAGLGLPENQDVQPQSESQTIVMCIANSNLHVTMPCVALQFGFGCPGSQQNQDMQNPLASWGVHVILMRAARCTLIAGTALTNSLAIALCTIVSD